MRGNPLWQLLAVAAAFVLMGLPVWKLTRPAQAAPMTDSATGGTAVPGSSKPIRPVTMTAEANFAPAPTEFTLSYLDKPILQGKAQSVVSTKVTTPVPTDGADLVLHAIWPSNTGTNGGDMPVAARVVIRLSDGRQVEKSFWSKSGVPLDAVLSVPGSVAVTSP